MAKAETEHEPIKLNDPAIFPPVRIVVVTYEELHKTDRVIDENRFNLYDQHGAEYCRVCATPLGEAPDTPHFCSRACEQYFYYYFTWRGVRERYREDHNFTCEKCGRPAKQVHHKVPLSWGGSLLEDRNLELLCNKCHAEIHRVIKSLQNPNRAPRPRGRTRRSRKKSRSGSKKPTKECDTKCETP